MNLFRFSALLIVLLLAATACGSSSGDAASVVTGSSITASFTADQPSPGPDVVSLDEGSRAGDLVTVDIKVTDISDVYGAAFDVAYDSGMATFENWSSGSLLEQGGQTPTYLVNATQPGQLIISVERQGNVGGAEAVGTVTLIRLTFRVTQSGVSPVSFPGIPTLLDSQPQPQPIFVTGWYGGTIVGA
jgi:hypothetical protein